ncbi:autotransporter outer membrane beta-barrel domain-containing protein [Ereboglobus luteus]|uniref:Autotransporter domain-containing protein n=1 Tax=Ereboglobus luteus TaxID=1796921 RepID=A0A2U8E030_9BACT|nr:autotransporter outer membrane beta-barrel domain-containing protein [Ereboglobus luteus]AWI08161.1 hypothetical protein CKA38_01785 [Ereboglobus luteus]
MNTPVRRLNPTLKLAAALVALCAAGAAVARAAEQYRHSFQNSLVTSDTMWVIQTGTYYMSPGSWTLTGIDFTNTNQAGAYIDTSAIDANANATYSTTVTFRNVTAHAGGATSALRRQAVSVRNGATINIFSGTLTKEHADTVIDSSEAVNVTGRSTFHGEDILIQAIAPRVRALNIASDSVNKVTLVSSTLTTTGSAAALNFAGAGRAYLDNVAIATTGNSAPGVQFARSIALLDYDGGTIRTTGENSSGLWLGAGNVATHVKAVLKNVDVRADQGAALDINTHIPDLLEGPTIPENGSVGSTGLYEVALENSTLSGALGSIRITSSATNGAATASAEIPTRAIITLQSSTLAGDVSVRSAARLELTLADSRLDGSLRAFDNTAGILNLSGATTITGTLAATGAATLEINLDNHTLAAPIHLGDTAGASINAGADSRVAAPITVDPGATLRFNLAGAGAFRAGTVNLSGRLRISGPAILDEPLALNGSDATIIFANAAGDDLTLAAGATGTASLVVESLAPGALGQSQIRLVVDETGSLSANTFTLAGSGTIDLGLATYTLENSGSGAYLVIGSPASGGYIGSLLNITAAAPAAFLGSLDPVHSHLASRREAIGGPLSPVRKPIAKGDSGSLWMRFRAGSLSADSDNLFTSFDQTTTALVVGGDINWDTASGDSITAGAFADLSNAEFDFPGSADGRTRSVAGGLYASWFHHSGWFATATARLDSLKHKLDTPAADLRARYNNHAVGGAVEFGRGIAWRAWWFEPALQAAFVYIDSAKFTTQSAAAENRAGVNIGSTRAVRALAALRASRTFGEGPFSLHARLAAVHTDASGGSVRAAGFSSFTRQLEGWSGEASIGAACNLGAFGRVSAECGHTLADDYDRPWTLSIGYSYAW